MKQKVNLIIGLSSGILLMIFISLTKGWGKLINELVNLKIGWIIAAFVAMILYWVFEGKTLQIITSSLSKKQQFKKSFRVTMIGQFFNSITPFASGGQPAQLYALSKEGIGTGKAGSILMVKFIVYQTVLTIYSIVLLVWKAEFFRNKLNNIFYLSGIGFLVNTSVIVFLIVFSRYNKITMFLFSKISNILVKLKILKDPEKLEHGIKEQLERFHNNVKLALKDKTTLIKAVILTVLQLTVYYLIPYCIYCSFGYPTAGVVNMIAANSFVIMITSFIPLPGSAGGAEGGFYMFFRIFFSKNNILTGVLLWRIVTFYSCIVFGSYFMMKTKYKYNINYQKS